MEMLEVNEQNKKFQQSQTILEQKCSFCSYQENAYPYMIIIFIHK